MNKLYANYSANIKKFLEVQIYLSWEFVIT
jgi:hypothetical protein